VDSEDRARGRALEALREAVELALHFPLLRPEPWRFDAWVDAVGPVERVTGELLNEGLALLDEDELERIAHGHASEHPQAWAGICRWIGDETVAEEAVLAGAVAAALQEQRVLDPDRLSLVEGSAAWAAPDEALAVVLEATDLWSLVECCALEEAIGHDPGASGERWPELCRLQARRLLTPRHERRVGRLLGRIRAQLPVAGYPQASRLLARACREVEQDAELRASVAAILLGDALAELWEELAEAA